MAESTLASYAELLDRALGHFEQTSTLPFLLGIAGPPGVGKSRLARRVVKNLSEMRGLSARCCPMDGFHLPGARLESLGLRDVKGRIDTFDALALLTAVRRLAARESFWWPVYSRTRHEPVANGIWISGKEDICVIEGNYLFAASEPWQEMMQHFGLKVFVDAPDDVLRTRLLGRHTAHGRGRKEAMAKIVRNDLPNAKSIRARRHAADIIIDGA